MAAKCVEAPLRARPRTAPSRDPGAAPTGTPATASAGAAPPSAAPLAPLGSDLEFGRRPARRWPRPTAAAHARAAGPTLRARRCSVLIRRLSPSPLLHTRLRSVDAADAATPAEPAPAAAAAPADEGAAAADIEAECDTEFKPVIQLEEVDEKSGEEDETVEYEERGKLYRYGESMLDVGSGKKGWNDRGVGQIKLLKHKENSKYRVLMRQEKTAKIICNHILDPRITLGANCGSDKAWVWSAFDFAEGELVEEIFSLKFGTPEKAQAYKAAFDRCAKEMEATLAGEDAATGGAEADEAADALAGLTTKAEADSNAL